MYLIWVDGLRGPEVQKCIELPRDNATNKDKPILGKMPLSEEEFNLPLTDLKRKYLAPSLG